MSTAIITGASGGIGREFAIQLCTDYGVKHFWLIARNRNKLESLAAKLSELGAECEVLSIDLGKREGIDTYKAALAEKKPTVSYLINAAGYGKFGRFDELSEDDIAGMIDLNSRALVLMTHATVPYMNKGGRIVELGSGSCFTPLPNFNVYAASKSLVLHYTKALNYELKRYGIRATCFCPGWVKTEFFDVAESGGERVSRPAKKNIKPLNDPVKVTRGCLKAVKKGKAMYVTNWFTKMQHVLFKLVPDPILTRMWLRMQEKSERK